MSIRVLVADDHEVVRCGIRSLFQGTEIQVQAEATSGEDAVAKVKKERDKVDVVLLDVRMPDGDGLNALGRIKLDRPDMPIVILSSYDNPRTSPAPWRWERRVMC